MSEEQFYNDHMRILREVFTDVYVNGVIIFDLFVDVYILY
jgi:hypothetical protein